ncbi:MxaA protein [Aurantimonas sp. 22II-16-19i]|nr:MxaA protein [Aurantimonas sp. 22II-16-19i]
MAFGFALSFILPGGRAVAADGDIVIRADPPREVGWFLGDVLVWRGEITAPAGRVLDPASLPKTGPIDAFTELSSVSLESKVVDGGVRHDLTLVYQSFYVPLEPKEIAMPGATLAFWSGEAPGAGSELLTLPAWKVVLSPLRPIMARSSAAAMRPDEPLAVIDTVGRQWTVAAAWTGFLVLALGFAWYRGIGPFGLRRSRPLAAAWRAMRARRPEPGYGERLLALHRGLDAAFGRRVVAADLGECLAARPHFAALRGDLEAFFAASRRFFFDGDARQAEASLPGRALVLLARRLAAIERAGAP